MGLYSLLSLKIFRQLIEDRLKVVEDPADGQNKAQQEVVNKIKELLNNRIHESTGDAAGAIVAPYEIGWLLSM